MSVIRVNKNKNFTVMSNYHLKDKSLSLKAKGLLCLILSLPEDWDYSIKGLCAICKENETAVKSTLDELKRFKYLSITKQHSVNGRFEYVYNIYEQPCNNLPEVGKPPLVNPAVENQVQLNTKELSTKEYKEIIKESNFNTFWERYPYCAKRNFKKTEKGFIKSSLEYGEDRILQALYRYIKEIEFKNISSEYIVRSDNFVGDKKIFVRYLEQIEQEQLKVQEYKRKSDEIFKRLAEEGGFKDDIAG